MSKSTDDLLDDLQVLVESLEKTYPEVKSGPLKVEPLNFRFFRKITYSNKPINLHGKGKKFERELSNMEIWKAISK